MNHFIIRNNEIQIFNGETYFKSSVDLFKQLEPTFDLTIDIKQIEYFPELLHEVIHFNGEVNNLELESKQYNKYIESVDLYLEKEQDLLKEQKNLLLPKTLKEAKALVIEGIYAYTSYLINNLTSSYSTAERDRWASIILPEAQAYLISKNLNDCPNLTAQEIVRTGITDTNLPEFKDSLSNRITKIIQATEDLNQSINYYSGLRGKWIDKINAFKQTKMETEKQAITRLLAIDYKVGWELPNLPSVP